MKTSLQTTTTRHPERSGGIQHPSASLRVTNSFSFVRRFLVATLLGMTLLLYCNTTNAQQCDPHFSVPNFVAINGTATKLIGEDYIISATIGQPIFETARRTSQNSVVPGFWAYHNLEPQSPYVSASDGDFVDVVVVTWEVVEGPVGPPVTGEYIKLYRNGSLLTTLPIIQTTYQDFNVQPGLVYVYEVSASNNLGEGQRISDVGFVNPNGVVTGHIQTRNLNPMNEVEVRLEPTLGYALDFNGTSDKITLTDSAYNNLSSGTIEAWVYLSQRVNNTIISKQHVGGEVMGALTIGYYLDVSGNAQTGDSGKIYFHGHNGVAASSNAKLKANKWYHIAVTFSTTQAQFYVNGSLDNTVSGNYSIPYDVDETDPTLIQTYIGGWSGGNKFYKGSLDEMRIWNTIRTKKELLTNMNRTLNSEDSELVAYWKFDEGQGDKIFDLSDNSSDGKICGPDFQNVNRAPVYTSALTDPQGNYRISGVSYGTGTTFSAIPSKTTIIGRALQFDGVNDYVSVPNNIVYPLGSFTIETWAYVPSHSVIWERIFDFGTGTSNYMFLTAKSGITGNPAFQIKKTSSGEQSIFSTLNFPLDQWSHIAITYDSATATGTMYIDGELAGTNSAMTVQPKDLGTTTQNYFGKSQFSADSYFKGRLDDFRIWTVARTQQEIQAKMNQPLTGSETGLRSYWKLNEGNGLSIYDETPYARGGSLINADSVTVWTDEIALNETFEHIFQPESRNVTLSANSPSVDQVEFTDISLLAVTGFMKYEGSNCFVDSAEVLVDGRSANPPIYTNASGKFIAEFEPGSSHRLTPKLKNHQFIPPYWDITNIAQPILLTRPFINQEKRTLKGFVVGGNCRIPIGTSEVSLVSVNGCYEQVVLTDAFGNFEFTELPPIRFNIFVKHPDPTITFDGEQVNLVDNNDSVQFVYRSPLLATILDLPTNDCNMNVIEKGRKKRVRYKIYESYTDGSTVTECPMPNGQIVVIDKIGNIERRDTLDVVNGFASDTIKGGTPNILAGGAHPYQKQLQIIGIDDLGREAIKEEWIYALGQKPRGSTFATRTPEMPLWILHDPPGDASYSYVSTDNSMSTAVSFSMENSQSDGMFVDIHLGPDVTTSFGLGAETEFEVDATIDFTTNTSVSVTQTSTTEQTWTFTSSETFQTSDGDAVIGDGGDVYIGGAMNMLYGITDVLKLDSLTCAPYLVSDLLLIPDNFATTFMYSESHILNTVIPNLQTIGDTTSAQRWQTIVNKNHANKTAATFIRNISFDAGTTYENSETTERTTTSTLESSLTIGTEIAVALGLTVNGVGGEFGFNVTTEYTTGSSRSNSSSNVQTFGYVLADDDAGDYFSVNVRKDPVYGTPVFQLVSGATSCPWEDSTMAREGVQLQIDPIVQNQLPPDEDAAFTLTLANTSPTGEARFYAVYIDYTSNPNGAFLSINGADLGGGVPLVLPPGVQVPLTLFVTRAPNYYDYDNLRVFLVSQCEYENSFATGTLPSQFSDTVSFSVHFEVPCSDVAMPFPTDNWLVSSNDPDTVMVTLNGYDKDNPDFEELQLQYRIKTVGKSAPQSKDENGYLILDSSLFRPIGTPIEDISNTPFITKRTAVDGVVGGNEVMKNGSDEFKDNPWITAVIIPKDSLPDNQNYIIVPWKVTSDVVPDGEYELRAISKCFEQTIIGTSAMPQGIIDRTPPTVFGTPSPVDGILNANDQISVTFEEPIDCSSLQGDSVILRNMETGLQIDKNYTCNGSTITIVPNIQNSFIENRTLRVQIFGLKDAHGNKRLIPVVWEFYVQRNQVAWNDPRVSIVKEEGTPYTFTRTLLNSGGSSMSFTITGLPPWLIADPMAGTIPAGLSQIVTFNISDQLSGGLYKDTAYAHTSQGDQHLLLTVRVVCDAPVWTVNPANFEHSMNIIGKLSIDGLLSDDTYDRVAVFVNGEVRGVGSVTYVDTSYKLFLTIYSNLTSGEPLSFHIWDASSCRELVRIEESYTFNVNTVIGSLNNPTPITATSVAEQQITLSKGWTWFSLNLASANDSVNSILRNVSILSGSMIKSQSAFSQAVVGFGWVGTLTTLNNKSMYQTKLISNDTLVYAGAPVAYPDTIPIVSGVNWISFQPQTGLSLNTALASLPSLNGDLIKSQFAFAVYQAPIGWLGNLSFLSPKLGYLIKAGSAGNLIYPPQAFTKWKPENEITPPQHFPQGWAVNPSDYQYSMQIIGEAQPQGISSVDSLDLMGAFVNNECRGVVKPIYVGTPYDKYYYFLLVYSNAISGEQMHFRFFDSSEQAVHLASQVLSFKQDSLVGSVATPYVWNISATGVGNEQMLPKEFSLSQNYPNPFNPATIIRYALPKESYVEIIVYDLLGQKVKTLVAENQSSGYRSIAWDGTDNSGGKVSSGMYLYRMVAGSFVQAKKLVMLK